MRPLADLPKAERTNVKILLADVDDTITTGGKLTSTALAALERAHEAGKSIILVTGRSAGWCDHMARMWPVDAVVGENGAFYFNVDKASGRMIRRYIQSREERRRHWRLYEQALADILSEVPGAVLAGDQAYRETDLAIDIGEERAPLPWEDVEKIIAIMRKHGMWASPSNCHVNGWHGDHDKLSATRLVLTDGFGLDLEDMAERRTVAFIGDSLNDQPLFNFFPNSVGVANVRRWEDRLNVKPTYITEASWGDGFREAIDFILQD